MELTNVTAESVCGQRTSELYTRPICVSFKWGEEGADGFFFYNRYQIEKKNHLRFRDYEVRLYHHLDLYNINLCGFFLKKKTTTTFFSTYMLYRLIIQRLQYLTDIVHVR